MRNFVIGAGFVIGTILFAAGGTYVLVEAATSGVHPTTSVFVASLAMVVGAALLGVINYRTRMKGTGPMDRVGLGLGTVAIALVLAHAWVSRLGRPDLEAWSKSASILATLALSAWSLYFFARRARGLK